MWSSDGKMDDGGTEMAARNENPLATKTSGADEARGGEETSSKKTRRKSRMVLMAQVPLVVQPLFLLPRLRARGSTLNLARQLLLRQSQEDSIFRNEGGVAFYINNFGFFHHGPHFNSYSRYSIGKVGI